MSTAGGAVASITPLAFIKKWKSASLTERQTAQEHFIDLCALFNHPTPIEDDPTGDHFAFEKGATKIGGGKGFADVWKKDFFAWEYKRKNGNLDDALHQLVRYAPALESPPLQVVCDIERFRIHTAWTNTVPARYDVKLDDLADTGQREILRNVFFDPEKLKPTKTRAAVTKEAADKFSTIALRLQGRGSPEEIAHFVNQLVFCFFAHSVKLLPDGLFPKLLKQSSQKPEKAQNYLSKLFEAMEGGGDFDLNDIAWFNGGLFDGRRALSLDEGDIGLLVAAGSLDWGLIDPSIFGTLFERFLDPDKRAQIGAHYTDRDKITKLIEPVIFGPLQEEWSVAKSEIKQLLSKEIKPPMRAKRRRRMTPQEAAEEVRSRYLERLRNLRILDPACGSGNFLYLALQGVKDIENKANLECEMLGLDPRLPVIGPEIVRGIEINPLAAELARTTIWIGDIQWRLRNGIHAKPKPILRKLDAIECRDALITATPSLLGNGGVSTDKSHSNDIQAVAKCYEAKWPDAEFIVGNPPFLGSKLMRSGLGDSYVDALFQVYRDRVPAEADLVTYWFEKARNQLSQNRSARVGFVSTNSIRSGASRRVLERVLETAPIFEAWSDQPWVIDGAAVRVSLICYGTKSSTESLRLNGCDVKAINADLSSNTFDVTRARRLTENRDVAFQGITKGAPFEVRGDQARAWLVAPKNPNGRANRDVLRRIWSGGDIVRRQELGWVIDFSGLTERQASYYEDPFQYVIEFVKPLRLKNRRALYRTNWWLFSEGRPGLRAAVRDRRRYIATPKVSRHRVFVWFQENDLPDNLVIAIARDDDTTFGILQSRFHEAWALARCAWMGVGNDPTYTPTTTLETFPFPEGLTPNISANHYKNDRRASAIAKTAKRLDDLRNAWLNPPDLVRFEAEVVPGYPNRILPKDTAATVALRERTLTILYNQRPQWLTDAHRDLDAAVAAAYGWQADISEMDALAKLLELNLSRGAALESTIVQPKSKRKPRRIAPEERRRSPQFKLPIRGGKQLQEKQSTLELSPIDQSTMLTARTRRRRKSG
jgi:type II restriction/modification system DNA methylase subunit YeeA